MKLKRIKELADDAIRSRSREGAWIEMRKGDKYHERKYGRSREGAWIEIGSTESAALLQDVAPARERGLKLL